MVGQEIQGTGVITFHICVDRSLNKLRLFKLRNVKEYFEQCTELPLPLKILSTQSKVFDIESS